MQCGPVGHERCNSDGGDGAVCAIHGTEGTQQARDVEGCSSVQSAGTHPSKQRIPHSPSQPNPSPPPKTHSYQPRAPGFADLQWPEHSTPINTSRAGRQPFKVELGAQGDGQPVVSHDSPRTSGCHPRFDQSPTFAPCTSMGRLPCIIYSCHCLGRPLLHHTSHGLPWPPMPPHAASHAAT